MNTGIPLIIPGIGINPIRTGVRLIGNLEVIIIKYKGKEYVRQTSRCLRSLPSST
jgi:hypothetical protein